MLWNDSNFVTPADISTLDNEIFDVARAEGLDLENNIIPQALFQAGDSILMHMRQFGGAYLGDGSVSANHYAAVMNTGLTQGERSRVSLSQVVVSAPVSRQWSALKRWAAHWCLMGAYRDAAVRASNDRYATKAEVYRNELHGRQWATLRALGLPVVDAPLPCPGALYEPGAGTWDTSNVTTVPGPGTSTDAVDVVVTWVDPARTNGESNPSAPVTVQLASGSVLRVDITSLAPPNGTQPASTVAQAYCPYGRATGWNVYAGASGGPLWLQTATPVDIATKTLTLAADPVTGTALVGIGQWPVRFIAFHRVLQRG